MYVQETYNLVNRNILVLKKIKDTSHFEVFISYNYQEVRVRNSQPAVVAKTILCIMIPLVFKPPFAVAVAKCRIFPSCKYKAITFQVRQCHPLHQVNSSETPVLLSGLAIQPLMCKTFVENYLKQKVHCYLDSSPSFFLTEMAYFILHGEKFESENFSSLQIVFQCSTALILPRKQQLLRSAWRLRRENPRTASALQIIKPFYSAK